MSEKKKLYKLQIYIFIQSSQIRTYIFFIPCWYLTMWSEKGAFLEKERERANNLVEKCTSEKHLGFFFFFC